MTDFQGVDMTHPTLLHGQRAHSVDTFDRTSPTQIARELGDVIYATRMPGGIIKIGFTSNLLGRVGRIGGLRAVIAVRAGTLAEEQQIHAGLVASLHHGREYYNATPDVMAVVNAMRAAANVPPLAA
jgi:hypothetical protein